MRSLVVQGGEQGPGGFVVGPALDRDGTLAGLREDVDRVRSCELLAPGVVVEGWRYDVETGLISQEVPS